jgi:hypothetical protein
MSKAAIIFCLLLGCASAPAWGSIARVGSCSGTTSCTPNAAAVGAVEYAFAFRSGSTNSPSVPTNGCGTSNIAQPCWQTVFTQATTTGGTTGVLVVACRVDVTGAAAASGTFSSATNLGIVSYSGTGARTTADCGLNLIPIGGNASTFAKTSTTVTYPGVTMSDSSGASWIIGAMGDSTSANTCTPTTALTQVTGASTGDLNVSDSNGGMSGYSPQTCTVTSSTWVSQVFEIVARQTAAAIPTQLFQAYASLSNVNDPGEQGNLFTFIAPDPSPAGNWIGFDIDWALPSGCATASACEPVITDNIGTNTYTVAQACTFSSNGVGQELVYIANAAASTQNYVIDFSGFGPVIQNFHMKYINLNGIAITSPVDGTPVCNEGQLPGSNAFGNVSAGTITTTQSGDIVWATTTGQNPGGTNGSDEILPATGALLTAVGTYLNAAQELFVQPSSGAINPGFGVMQEPSTGYDYMGTMAIALKTDPTKGSGYSGIHILTAQQDAADGNTVQRYQIPCTGNLCLIVGASGSAVADTYTSVTTFPSVSWSMINPATNQGFIWVGSNASADSSMNGVSAQTTPTGVETNLFYLNIVNAAASPIDTSVTCGGSSLSDAAQGTCYNTNGNGLVQIGQATSSAISSSQTSIPLVSSSSCTNGNYAILDTGANTEVVQITAGCGTSTLTVNRATGTVAYYYTTAVSHTGNVYLMPSTPAFADAPTIAPSTANGLVITYGNNGSGPPASYAAPAHLLQIWYFGERDNSRLGNGDEIGMYYPTSTASNSVTVNLQNGAPESPGSGTTWQAAATSFLGTAPSGAVVRHRAWVIQ